MKTIAGLRAKVKARGEGGFSLVEMLVVVLIIGVLLAIAIPSFLSARTKAQARGPQTSVVAMLTAAKAYATDQGDFTGLACGAGGFNEPSYNCVAGTTAITDANKTNAGKRTVAFTIVSASEVRLWAKGDNGNCYIIDDNIATGTTLYGNHTGDCVASEGAVALNKWNL
ncbi:MAG TPA: prepilin-type N-terminal cleavage/methylation domain-containing protein [Acidimicrobiales bacterium]|nr:prepilin-type N-terminal cleavage/methylation domain-containing protein [Acidimicrobiales bacterium]